MSNTNQAKNQKSDHEEEMQSDSQSSSNSSSNSHSKNPEDEIVPTEPELSEPNSNQFIIGKNARHQEKQDSPPSSLTENDEEIEDDKLDDDDNDDDKDESQQLDAGIQERQQNQLEKINESVEIIAISGAGSRQPSKQKSQSKQDNKDRRQSDEISLTEQQKAILLELKQEEERSALEQQDKELLAKFYAREGDRFGEKIYIYFLIFSFDVAMKLFASVKFFENGMGRYLAAQLCFLIIERMAKVILFSSLGIYRLVVLNFVFMDYLAIQRYLELRKTLRNYNLYNAIVKRIDILIWCKIIEATLLSGPSLLITLYASINGLGDRINSFYILSISASAATLVFANLELLDLQLVQCKFNSLSNTLRNQFEQKYSNLARDLVVVLINIVAQAGFWMICCQIPNFVLAHGLLSFLYIVSVTFVIVFQSLARENQKQIQEKSSVNIKTVAAALSIMIGTFLFVLIYCMFFFLRTKKLLYVFLLQNTEDQNKKLESNINKLMNHFPQLKSVAPITPQDISEDYHFYQFMLALFGITAFRVYCILNIVGLILCDSLINDSTAYVGARLKRDMDLFILIKNEKRQNLYLRKLMKAAKVTFPDLNQLPDRPEIDIFKKNSKMLDDLVGLRKSVDLQKIEQSIDQISSPKDLPQSQNSINIDQIPKKAPRNPVQFAEV